VTDGRTGARFAGAFIDGFTTNKNGLAKLTFPKKGGFQFRATMKDSIRSNALYVAVV